jgi:hypothetical protein
VAQIVLVMACGYFPTTALLPTAGPRLQRAKAIVQGAAARSLLIEQP